MATSLSGSCSQTLLTACIWWDTFVWTQQSIGVQMSVDTQQNNFCISDLLCGTVCFMSRQDRVCPA